MQNKHKERVSERRKEVTKGFIEASDLISQFIDSEVHDSH